MEKNIEQFTDNQLMRLGAWAAVEGQLELSYGAGMEMLRRGWTSVEDVLQ